jgi:hypothetical protein
MKQQGYKIHDTPLMMLARFVLQDCSQTSSQHAVSAVTPQRAIINIASAGSVLQMN